MPPFRDYKRKIWVFKFYSAEKISNFKNEKIDQIDLESRRSTLNISKSLIDWKIWMAKIRACLTGLAKCVCTF